MAGGAKKKLLKGNEEWMEMLFPMTAGSHGLYIALWVLAWFDVGGGPGWWDKLFYGLVLVLSWYSYRACGSSSAQGFKIEEGCHLELEFLLLSCPMLLLAAYSSWGWLCLLAIPLYGVYKAWGLLVGFIFPQASKEETALTAMSDEQRERFQRAQSAKVDKAERKAERQENRRKNMGR